MKKIILSLTLLVAAITAYAPTTNFLGDYAGSKHFQLLPLSVADIPNEGLVEHDHIALTAPLTAVGPKIDFLTVGPPNSGGFIWWTPSGFILSSNLTLLGSLNTSSNVIWQTNAVWATNALMATNAIYATNAADGFLIASTNYVGTNLVNDTLVTSYTNTQTVTVDMRKPYGDLVSAGAVTFVGITGKSGDAYQTAVVLIKNSTPGAGDLIAPPTECHRQGTPYLTNETICTFFYNPNGWTNVTILPLW